MAALTQLRRPVRHVVHFLPEVPIWSSVITNRTRTGRRCLFLPANDRSDGAADLRIYRIADGLKVLGWQVLVLPPKLTLQQRRRMIRAFGPDVLVMQGVRHALNRPELYPGQPIVLDMDDADFHLAHLHDAVVQAMPRIETLIAGSRYIAEWGRGAGVPRAEVVWTGTPVSARARPAQAARRTVVAWGQTRPMTYVREAALVRQVLASVASRRPGVTLRLYDRLPGDDPAFAESFAAPGLVVEWRARASYDTYLASFDDVAVGLAPLCPETPFSRGKSFGKVLAYLDRKVPVIGSDAGEHDAFFTVDTGEITNDRAAWGRRLLSLLDDPVRRQLQADAAFQAFQTRLQSAVAVRRVDEVLRHVLASAAVEAHGDRSWENA